MYDDDIVHERGPSCEMDLGDIYGFGLFDIDDDTKDKAPSPRPLNFEDDSKLDHFDNNNNDIKVPKLHINRTKN